MECGGLGLRQLRHILPTLRSPHRLAPAISISWRKPSVIVSELSYSGRVGFL